MQDTGCKFQNTSLRSKVTRFTQNSKTPLVTSWVLVLGLESCDLHLVSCILRPVSCVLSCVLQPASCILYPVFKIKESLWSSFILNTKVTFTAALNTAPPVHKSRQMPPKIITVRAKRFPRQTLFQALLERVC